MRRVYKHRFVLAAYWVFLMTLLMPADVYAVCQSERVNILVLGSGGPVAHRMQRTLGKEKATLTFIRQSYSGPVVFADDLDVIKPD